MHNNKGYFLSRIIKNNIMKITICGSMTFYDEMQQVMQKLHECGHEVRMPLIDPISDKATVMRDHFDKIAWSDAVLIINLPKHEIDGYIGANTLIEMGVAAYLHKKIFLYNAIPEMDCATEIIGMNVIAISEDLSKIL